jgi:predicted porin
LSAFADMLGDRGRLFFAAIPARRPCTPQNNEQNTQMKVTKALLAAALCVGAGSHPAYALEADFYGSLRIGVEAVDPDNDPGNFGSYVDFRDAYSRVGLKLTQAISENWSLMAQGEVPLDLANLDMHSPYDNRDNVRIAKLQLNSPFGTVWYGRGWMAFYNYIAYPVDYFSSYYSGWATFTTFRRENTLYYASPSWNGLQVAFASTDDNGSSDNKRNQYVLSYANSGLSLAGGLDDTQEDYKIWGAAASYTTGPWYIAAKYEELDYSVASPYDGDSVANLLLQYALDGKNTLRGMVAEVGWDYGDTVLHLGWDHQYNDDLKFFVEYYQEESTAAIADRRKSTFLGSPSFNAPADSGGRVFTTGLRYDF